MSTHGTPRPVTPDERVSDVLARDESLVAVFSRLAPPLGKLRNRAMRRVMARLVTVEQAARMAGVSAASLTRALNDALGISPAVVDTAAIATEESRTRPSGAPVVELDVREDLRGGREPFSRIMAAVASLGEGDVLRLRAIFEPVPLLAVLAKRGFEHETREHAPDDWSVWFWRPAVGAAGGAAGAAAPQEPALATHGSPAPAGEDPIPGKIVWLDVRGLEPPEPLVRTLTALEALPTGHTLIQVNMRVPQFLFPLLAERGFACELDDSAADRVLVRIWHAP